MGSEGGRWSGTSEGGLSPWTVFLEGGREGGCFSGGVLGFIPSCSVLSTCRTSSEQQQLRHQHHSEGLEGVDCVCGWCPLWTPPTDTNYEWSILS